MPRSPEIEAWAAPLVNQRQVVLHLATGTIAKVEALFIPGAYLDSSGRAVNEYVLKLATGDSFILPPPDPAMHFVVLSPVEVQYLDATAAELSKTITRAIGAALVTRDGPFPIAAESALRLIEVALQGQIRALQQAAEDSGGNEG